MRILVTGGAGFLGSHLSERLLEQGHEVFCVDNLLTGSRYNVELLREHAGFEFVWHDVTQPLVMEVDRIYHLACPASPVHYQRNPVRTVQTAVLGTLNMLDLARQVGARILVASTSEVYGDPQQHPQTETYWGHVNPIGARACYDEGKRCGEALAVSYARQYRVETRIPRIFNTYGPRMHEDDGRVVSNFIVQALSGEALTLHGNGSQTRSFCYVRDLVEALICLMELPADPGPINLGNPEELNMMALARLVLKLTGSNSKIEHRALPPDDPVQRKPNIDKARNLLGWSPKTELMEGLEETIRYFRGRLARDVSRGAGPAVARLSTRAIS